MTVEFSYPIKTSVLDVAGQTFTLKADDKARVAVCERLSLVSLDRLTAELNAIPDGDPKSARTGVRIDGRLCATGNQTCVVSLEPVPFDIEAPVRGLALPADAPEHEREELTLEDDDVDILGEITDDVLDLGEIVVQQLALELDPFPRAPGAESDWPDESGGSADSASDSPFAALEKLKKTLK